METAVFAYFLKKTYIPFPTLVYFHNFPQNITIYSVFFHTHTLYIVSLGWFPESFRADFGWNKLPQRIYYGDTFFTSPLPCLHGLNCRGAIIMVTLFSALKYSCSPGSYQISTRQTRRLSSRTRHDTMSLLA